MKVLLLCISAKFALKFTVHWCHVPLLPMSQLSEWKERGMVGRNMIGTSLSQVIVQQRHDLLGEEGLAIDQIEDSNGKN